MNRWNFAMKTKTWIQVEKRLILAFLALDLHLGVVG
jgi:hypothetical protein